MRLTKLDLKKIIQEEIQNLFEETTDSLKQEFDVTPKEMEKMRKPYSDTWWTNRHGYNRGTKMAPIVDDSPMGGTIAAEKFKSAHGRDPKDGDVVYYLNQAKNPRTGDSEWNYATFTFGKTHVPDTPDVRRAKLKEIIQEEYDELLDEAEEEGEGTTIDISTVVPGGVAPHGIPQEQWQSIGSSAIGE